MDLDSLFSLNCGMYILCSGTESEPSGLIINALVQVTAFPNQVIASVNKESLTHEVINRRGVFTVSVLEKDTPLQLIGLFGFFSGRKKNKFSEVRHFTGQTGAPVITEHSVAYLEAKVISKLDAGTHLLYLGEVLEAEYLNPDLQPMLYNYYRDVKGGKVPRTAATYHASPGEEKESLDRYRCKVCGYIYDSRYSDPDSGIEAGTPFAALPAQWTCPICGAPRDQFEPV